jgi:hypothetical protein
MPVPISKGEKVLMGGDILLKLLYNMYHRARLERVIRAELTEALEHVAEFMEMPHSITLSLAFELHSFFRPVS